MQRHKINRLAPWLNVALMMLWICFVPAASAHGTDTHADAPNHAPINLNLGPVPQQAFVATSHDMEAVGIIDKHQLTIYIDQHESNAPVVQARVELKIGSQTYQAQESAPGVYTVDIEGVSLTDAGLSTLLLVGTTESVEQLSGILRSVPEDPHGKSTVWIYTILTIVFVGGLGIWLAYQRGIRLTTLKARVAQLLKGLKR